MEVWQVTHWDHGRHQLWFSLRCSAAPIRAPVSIASLWGGELDEAMLLHPEHGDAAAHVLELPIGTAPSKLLAHKFGKKEAVRTGSVDDERAYGLYF